MEESKLPIIITGGTGLVGSRIVEILSSKYSFEQISRSTSVDIVNFDHVVHAFENSNASVVLHLAAKANVDGCEEDKVLGVEGEAWKINVEGSKNIAQAAEKTNKKIIYISTDFVFDGKKEKGQLYTEEDTPYPINWYATTKYEGEKAVQEFAHDFVIARIAYPYRSSFPKKDFARALFAKLQNGEKIQAIDDHIMTPTFIDDITNAIDVLVSQNIHGIYHVVGSESLTPYEAACKIADYFGFDQSLISKTTRDEFFKNRAVRPFNLALKNDKIAKLGIQMKTFEEGLEKIKQQSKT